MITLASIILAHLRLIVNSISDIVIDVGQKNFNVQILITVIDADVQVPVIDQYHKLR
jgi:hypothetical protein